MTWGRWKDNITMDLREIRWKGVDWIHLAHDRVQWGVSFKKTMNLRVL